MTIRAALITLSISFVAACASSGNAVNEKAESSSASIRAAEEVGAKHTPQAALHLQLAKEQFEHAQAMKDPDDKAAADRLLLRAQADADLALALARTEAEKAEASAAVDKVKQLQAPAIQ